MVEYVLRRSGNVWYLLLKDLSTTYMHTEHFTHIHIFVTDLPDRLTD